MHMMKVRRTRICAQTGYVGSPPPGADIWPASYGLTPGLIEPRAAWRQTRILVLHRVQWALPLNCHLREIPHLVNLSILDGSARSSTGGYTLQTHRHPDPRHIQSTARHARYLARSV